MKKVLIVSMFFFLSIPFSWAIINGDFSDWDTGWTSYYTMNGECGVTFYGSPTPDPYVRLSARNGYAGIYQDETDFDGGETWRATFTIKSATIGFGNLATIGWTDIFGDFGSYYLEITSPGTYSIDCNNASYPFVTAQIDAGIITAILEVDEIQTQDLSAPTPTPSPTPTAAPTCSATGVATWDFDTPPQGWDFATFTALEGTESWAHASSVSPPGAIGLQCPVGETTNYFASWLSPDSITFSPNKLWRAIFSLSCDKADESSIPSVRLRMSLAPGQKAASYIRFYPGDWLPLAQSPSTTDYKLYMRPPIDDANLFLAFDTVDFGPTIGGLAADGTVYVEEVTVDSFNLGDGCCDDHWSLANEYSGTELHSWTHGSAGGNLENVNSYSTPAEGLEQSTTYAQTRAFGMWVSPGEEIVLHPGFVYRARWNLASEDSTLVAINRMRMHTTDFRYASYMVINRADIASDSALPPPTGKDYYIYAEFPATPTAPNLFLAWDLYDFEDIAGGWARLTDVDVKIRTAP